VITQAPAARIGELDGGESEVFGNIADAVIDRTGNVLILDDRLVAVRAFTQAGKHRVSLGRAGSGPGEFREPHALAVTGGGDVFVADGGRRLERFRVRDDKQVEGSTIPLEFRAIDLCSLGESLVVHATSVIRSDILFVMDSAGSVLRSFGETYKSPNRRINAQIQEGMIACAEAERVIIYAPLTGIPEVRAYALDGRPLWAVAIDGMTPIAMSEMVGRPGSKRISLPPNGYHHLETLTYDPHGFVLAQVAFQRSGPPKRWEPDSLYTVAIDVRSGQSAMIGTELPPIIAISGNTILVTRSEPFPNVRIHLAKSR